MRKAKGQKKVNKGKKVEPVELVQSPEEQYFDAVIRREETEEVNSEGYHFIRPKWHRWVYGGGKQSEKD